MPSATEGHAIKQYRDNAGLYFAGRAVSGLSVVASSVVDTAMWTVIGCCPSGRTLLVWTDTARSRHASKLDDNHWYHGQELTQPVAHATGHAAEGERARLLRFGTKVSISERT